MVTGRSGTLPTLMQHTDLKWHQPLGCNSYNNIQQNHLCSLPLCRLFRTYEWRRGFAILRRLAVQRLLIALQDITPSPFLTRSNRPLTRILYALPCELTVIAQSTLTLLQDLCYCPIAILVSIPYPHDTSKLHANTAIRQIAAHLCNILRSFSSRLKVYSGCLGAEATNLGTVANKKIHQCAFYSTRSDYSRVKKGSAGCALEYR